MSSASFYMDLKMRSYLPVAGSMMAMALGLLWFGSFWDGMKSGNGCMGIFKKYGLSGEICSLKGPENKTII